MKEAIRPGKYRHYKGKDYEVLCLAFHTEDEEELVIYRSLNGNFEIWARPLKMFLETVEHEGKKVPRFEYLGKQHSCGCC